MRNTIVFLALMFVFVIGANAQSQNEFNVGYSFTKQEINLSQPTARFDKDVEFHGGSVGYTRYISPKSVVGITSEASVGFAKNDAYLATVVAGGIVKARNNAVVQPFARAMAGVSRQRLDNRSFVNATDSSFAYTLGGGIDWKASNKVSIRTGADYVSTSFWGDRQDAVRATVGFVF